MSRKNATIFLILGSILAILVLIFLSIDDEPARPRSVTEQMAEAGLLSLTPTPQPTATPAPTAAPRQAEPVPSPEVYEEEVLMTAARPTPRSLAVSPTSMYTPTPTPVRPDDATATPTPTLPDVKPEDEDSRDSKNMILDMDYSSDVDDVAALRIATQLDKNGRIKLLAVMASVNGEEVCKAMHAHLRYDGLAGVPVGRCSQNVPSGSPFWESFIEKYFDSGDYVVKDSISLYKEKLKECAAKGEKLRIVTTGFLVNIETLLKDPEGFELVKNNVDAIWIVGGSYPNLGKDYNFWYTENTRRAIKYVNENCPVKLVYSSDITSGNGNEVKDGKAVRCGGQLQDIDKSGSDPVNVAYRCYEKEYSAKLSGEGHLSWDPMCVWAAGLTRAECRLTLAEINAAIYDDGSNLFIPAENELRKMIVRTDADLDWYGAQLDALIYQGVRQ